MILLIYLSQDFAGLEVITFLEYLTDADFLIEGFT